MLSNSEKNLAPRKARPQLIADAETSKPPRHTKPARLSSAFPQLSRRTRPSYGATATALFTLRVPHSLVHPSVTRWIEKSDASKCKQSEHDCYCGLVLPTSNNPWLPPYRATWQCCDEQNVRLLCCAWQRGRKHGLSVLLESTMDKRAEFLTSSHWQVQAT
eukprot:5018639-Pleurochrysis_carterae.AAC.5